MITVNGLTWKVKYTNRIKRSDGSYALGMTDGNTRTIYLLKNLSGYMLDKVICHELTHVISFSYNLKFDMETEEKIADFISTYGREVFGIADGFLCKKLVELW